MHIRARDGAAALRLSRLTEARGRPKPSLRAKPRPSSGRGPLARGGPRSAPRRSSPSRSVGFPVSGIKEVMADCAETYFCDQRHHPFVVASTHALADVVDECGI